MNGHQTLDGAEETVEENRAFQVIHAHTLDQLKTETGAGFERVLTLFLKNFPERIHSLHSAWQGEDQEALKQVAHKLKGISATFGAERLSGLCAALEQQIERGSLPETIPEILDKILAEGQRVQKALQAFVPQSPT